ncbi:G-protein coupled receptor family C group 6 member A [Siniperca chuatsi]|uniref:G-protein coupled receptor family C group 6 member A n=1 Tax=Siniperca chuatsi TaxID=119488 RepID=UPI001CE1AB19|nr:G-protein coupled receptor family C group 6 member A [Siniperca chuatsi]
MHNNDETYDESCFCRAVTHPAVTHEGVGRAAGENMRTVNCEGGNKREFSFSLVEMLKKGSITLLEVKNHREASGIGERGKDSLETQRDNRQDSNMALVAPVIYLHITLFHIILEKGHAIEKGTRVLGATAPGDIIIGGIFAIHEDVDKKNSSFAPHLQPCIRFEDRGLVKVLAMINAIEMVNKSPLLADVNITLGYRILDSCSDVSTALRATADFTQQADCHAGSNTSTCGQPVMAVIGASNSETSIAIARQLTLKMIPQISYSSTAVILSDKSRFPAFMRTIPSDEHQTAAMVSLLSAFGWNWVGIVSTDGNYGQSALDQFVSQASENGICVSFKSILPQSVTGQEVFSAIKQTAKTIYKNPKVQVIVSFAKPTHMMYLYQELKNQTLTAGQNMESMRRVWVASDSWSSSTSVKGNLTLEDIGHVVGFTFKSGDLLSFSEYLSRLEAAGHDYTGNNSFMQEFYMQLNASKVSGDTELVSKAVNTLREHTDTDTIFSVEMAVSAIAQAVASICRSRDCKTPGTVQPWEVLKALCMQEFKLREKSYRFDSRGDINLGYDVTMWRSGEGNIHVHDVVAEYHPHNNNFTHTNYSTTQQFKELKHIISKCSNSCIPGEFKKTAEGQHTCCYECINCTENYYSNNTDMDQCLSCDTNTEWSPKGSSSCIPKALLFFSWQDGFAVVLLTFSVLGILLVLLVSALFLHQRDTPVVKAAGGPLSQAILFSLVISYISAMLFVGRPNSFQCKARQVLFGISFTLCVSCILVRTLQILLAFQFDPELQEVLRRLYQPYVIVSICVALQAAICICWLVLKSPFDNIISYPTTLLEDCNEGSYLAFGVMLGYIAVLVFMCFICAFKGRQLPQQYNEAKFITFSMLLYLISWLLFVPVYVTTAGVYLPAVEMVVILISNYAILSCHFFPKCYIILFKKKQNTKSAFRKNLYEYSSKTTDSVSVSESSVSERQSSGHHFIISASPLSVPAANPLEPAVVTNCRDGTSCTSLRSGSITRHCLRRSTSI